jgi:O-antigen ligase
VTCAQSEIIYVADPLDVHLGEQYYGSNEGTLSSGDRVAVALVGASVLIAAPLVMLGYRMEAALIAAIPISIAIIASPLVGMALLLLIYPLEDLFAVGGITPTRLIGVAVLLSFLPRMVSRNMTKCFQSRALRWMFALVLWGILILPLADSPLAGMIVLSTELQIAIMALLIASIPRNVKQFRFLCMSLVFGTAMLALYSCVSGAETLYKAKYGDRLSLGGNPNALGIFLGTSLFVAACLWPLTRKFMKIALLGMGFLIVAAIGLTQSRSTWLAVALGSLFGPIVSRRTSFKIRMLALTVVLLVAASGFMLVASDTFGATGRLIAARFRTSNVGEMSEGRLEWIWPKYINVLKSNLLIGGGPGKTMYDGPSAHNDIIEVGAQKGLIGIALFLGMFYVAYRECSRNTNEWMRVASIMLIIYVLASGIGHTTAVMKSFGLAFGVIGAMVNLGLCPKPQPSSAQYYIVQEEPAP